MVFNMRYLDERVWVILRELRPLIERQHIDITKWQTKKKLFMRPEEADQDSMPWEAFDSSTDRWYGKDVYYWFRSPVYCSTVDGMENAFFENPYTD